MLALVRNRRGVVAEVEPFSGGDGGVTHLVTVEYLDPAPPIEERLLWEREVGAELQEATALPQVATLAPMPADQLDALVRAARWTALSPFADPDGDGPLDADTLAGPFHGAIQVEGYQLVPVLTALRMPRVTLLLADDVGLGKTIEAGLVLTELLLRRRVRRVLVLCPASLRIQWRDEMRDKFSLPFEIVDRDRTRELRRDLGPEANPWRSFPRIIASYDYLKQADVLQSFLAVSRPQQGSPHLPWDLLVVDEAHNLAPADLRAESHLTAMLRQITPLFEHRLFLTATPHNGHTWSFTGLLEMLDPVRFACKTEALTAAESARVEAILVRRLKEEINAVTDPPRFTERHPRERSLALGPEEAALSDAFQTFRRRLRDVVRARGRADERAGAFAVEILGKRLLSCPVAFADSWHRSLEGLHGPEDATADEVERAKHGLAAEGADDRETESRSRHAARTVGAWLRALADELEPEIAAVSAALEALDLGAGDPPHAERDPHADARFEDLVRLVESLLRRDGAFLANERIVVFTEYKTTLDSVQRRLQARYPEEGRIRVLYGGMDDAEREEVKAAFNDPSDPVRIMVATDAAAEGLNLQQTARYLLHWDIPWNPARIEQRNGRLDRHGQARDVTTFHFSSNQDQDLAFLGYVVDKIHTIRRDLGSMGEVFDRALERRLVQGEARQNVQDDLDAGVEAARGRAAIPRAQTAQAAAEERKLQALAAEVDFDSDTLRETLEVALHAPLQGPDARGSFLLPATLAAAWKEAADDTLRAHRPGRSLPRLLFDPALLIEEVEHRPIFRPRKDSVLLHLGHPFFQRALAHLGALRFHADTSCWTVRRGTVPAGAEALLLLTVEELAVNALQETFHRWVRTLAFPYRRGEVGALLPHQTARALRCGSRSTPEDLPRARRIWDEAEEPLRRFLASHATALTADFRERLASTLETARAEQDARFRQREGELSRLVQDQVVARLEREIAERRQESQQQRLFGEEQRLDQLARDIAAKEAEIDRRRSHYEHLRERLGEERTRVLEHLLPHRHALRGTVQVLPLAVEIRMPER